MMLKKEENIKELGLNLVEKETEKRFNNINWKKVALIVVTKSIMQA